MHLRSLFLAVALTGALVGCKTSSPEPDEDVVEQYTDELLVEELRPGWGEKAVAGTRVTVHYTGWLMDGRAFDSSVGKDPLTFKLGARQVIRGWDQGVLGMKVGEKRRLTIPPRLAYGGRTVGSIPANSRLIFEVELLGVSP